MDNPVGRVVEYTSYISAEGWDPSQRVLWYDIKPSDGDVPGLEIWEK